MFWYGNGMGGGAYVLMIVSMLAFWALVITGLVMLFRSTRRGAGADGGATAAHSTPQDLLAERFARSEIEEDELRSRLAALREHTGR